MHLRIAFIILFLFVFCTGFAQTDDIRFRRISPPGGYSFQAIHSFKQDRFGYMWMGGFDGVFRFDSKEIVRFTHHPGNPEGLPSNTITSIAIDKQNNIWAATNKGLCLFNQKTQQFERVRYTYENGAQSGNNLYSIQFDGEGLLWIADDYFFGWLNLNDNKLYRITDGLTNPPRLIYTDETNRLWLGTANGSVFLINQAEKKMVKIIEGPGSLARTICTSPDNIWVGYQQHGARMYNFSGELITHYTFPENPEYDIKNASVRKIWRDTRGQVWIGSYLGLFRSIGENLTHFNHEKYEGLPHNSIFDIYEDHQGGLWIGTWSGGVAYLHHSDNKFNNYRYSKEPGSISDNMISSFAQTPDGTLYVGTELFGLNRFNPLSDKFEPIDIHHEKFVVDIKAMEVDKFGGLWIASAFSGVYHKPLGVNRFFQFTSGIEDGSHVSAHEVYALCKSDSGIWIGTINGGINFYSFDKRKIIFKSNQEPFSQLLNKSIRSISSDNENNLWVTTLSGFYKINLPSGKTEVFTVTSADKHKTRSQAFYFARQLSDGNIWIGTGGDGVYRYNNYTDTLDFFDANGLLAGKDVYGIIEGTENTIWITSNDGLIMYNKADKTSRRFVITDGIQGNLFNPSAIYKDYSGNLYFGGTNGFSRLEPKPIHTNLRPPNVLIPEIIVNNRKIIPFQNGIYDYEKIVLEAKETSINFRFSADNYLLSDKNEFAYRLTNYINDWVDAGTMGTASFVNVPSGEYTFEVKACNNDGIWNETPTKITVVIQQFWYKSTLAIVFYSIVFVIILLLIIRFYRERLKLKKALLIEKMEHQQEEQLNEMKLRFFTNVSHEFRTPLTLIDGPVRQLLTAENLTEPQRKQLDTVKRNSNRLLQLINQILDLRKLDKGLGKLEIQLIELVHFINERVQSFSEEARSRNIAFQFSYSTSSCYLEADEEKLDKIIYNLLSNSFKFTPDNGEITITLNGNNTPEYNYSNQLSFGEIVNEEFVEIAVTDNGQGISGEDLPHVFERFEQGTQTKLKANSTGIGLNLSKDFVLMHRGVIIVQSTPDRGTRFKVQLPTKQKAQKIMFKSHEEVRNIKSWEIKEKDTTANIQTNKNSVVLVVEDNDDLRNHIIQLLENYYSVVFAANGKQGLGILNSRNVDLVISDVMMPQMDGFEFCQTIKSQIETSHIPVILLTALSSTENTTTGLDKGADAYISKPFEEQILISHINNLLLQRKRLQESFASRFISKQPLEIGNLDNYFLNKISTIVEDNFTNENFSVDMLSDIIGLSRSQLHRKLKQITNHSATEYINIVKIKKATALLVSRNFTVDEVAYKVGFNSHSYFSKCFKRIHGKSPKEFVKGINQTT